MKLLCQPRTTTRGRRANEDAFVIKLPQARFVSHAFVRRDTRFFFWRNSRDNDRKQSRRIYDYDLFHPISLFVARCQTERMIVILESEVAIRTSRSRLRNERRNRISDCIGESNRLAFPRLEPGGNYLEKRGVEVVIFEYVVEINILNNCFLCT